MLAILFVIITSCTKENEIIYSQSINVFNFTDFYIDTVSLNSNDKFPEAEFFGIHPDSFSTSFELEGLFSILFWRVIIEDTVYTADFRIPTSGNQLDPINPDVYFAAPGGDYEFGIDFFDSCENNLSVFLISYIKN
jgi:hypothetical protein